MQYFGRALMLLGSLAATTGVFAQEREWYFNSGLGYHIFDSDQKFDDAIAAVIGVEAKLNSDWGVEVTTIYSEPENEDNNATLDGEFISGSLSLLRYFNFNSDFVPYLATGVGAAVIKYDNNPLDDEDEFTQYNFGGGFRYAFNENLSLRTDARYLLDDDSDHVGGVVSIGLSYVFARSGSPAVAPADTDGDGVLDKDDQCPTEAGTLNGCPDADGDGIKDSEDACPSVAGIAKFNGCPDTDGDGIQDSEDECPTVAGTLNGCPDRDGDGVKDSEDECPSVAGTLNGCPDKDKDGVKDSEDQCPETYGLASNGGCPEVQEEVQQVLDLAVKNIQFNSGSDVLRPSSFESLNQVVQLMKENNFNIKLSGYTDNTGNAASNLELSKRRANSVKKYIVDQGIDASRISSDGYGIANPVADNSTREGRAANRRVEIEIIFR